MSASGKGGAALTVPVMDELVQLHPHQTPFQRAEVRFTLDDLLVVVVGVVGIVVVVVFLITVPVTNYLHHLQRVVQTVTSA